mgnify:CR=1 FL=1
MKRLRARLNRGDSWLTYDLANLAPGGKIDEDALEELESMLVMADVGIDTTTRIIDDLQKSLARKELKPETELGFHGHHNLAMGIANSLAAVEAGANRIDGSLAGLGAGAGNTPLEVFLAVCDRMGVETGVDLFKVTDVAEDLVTPILDFPVRIDRNSLTLGYAGVYSSFLLFAKRAEAKYGIPARELLIELGRQKMVGGQEDMIEDLALTLSRQRREAA